MLHFAFRCLASLVLLASGLRLQQPIASTARMDVDYAPPFQSRRPHGRPHGRRRKNLMMSPIGHSFHTLEEELHCSSIVKHRCPREQSLSIPYSAEALEHEETYRLLNNKRLVLIGDSLPWQFYMALDCFIDHEVNTTIEFHAMHVVPHDLNDLKSFLSSVTYSPFQHTTLIIGIGTWYNWDWSWPVNTTQMKDVPQEYTKTLMYERSCRDSTLFKDDSYKYAVERRRCNSLDANAFASDLARLKDALSSIRKEDFEVVWKSIPPQHWSTESGQFDWAKGSPPCVPIQNEVMAHGRNNLAECALGLFETNTSLHYLDTWKGDVIHHDMHAASDCTHFCNPSVVTWNWAGQLINLMMKTQPGHARY